MTALEPLDTRTPQRLAGHDLVLGFGRTEVVHGVSIELVPGRVTALVGPNGSGKSTLLRALARLHSPESGGVSIGSGERDALSMSPRCSPARSRCSPRPARPRPDCPCARSLSSAATPTASASPG